MNWLERYELTTLKQWLFVSLFAFPVFPLKLVNILFIVFSVLVVLQFLKERPQLLFRDYKLYALFVILFVPYFIEFLLYPADKVMQFELEKKLLFLVAPVFLYLNSILKVKPDVKGAIWSFIVSVSVLSVITILYLAVRISVFSEDSYQNGAFGLRASFEQFANLHPTYYGLFSSTASLWAIYYFNHYTRAYKIVLAIGLFFMILLNVLIAAKTPLFILIIGLLWIAYKKIPNKVKLSLIYASFFSFLFILVASIPSLKNRLSEVSDFFVNASVNNTVLERFVVFNCSKMVFVQDFYTGIGSRNAQNLLDFCYLYFKFYKGQIIHLNSHNQYLTFGISYGIYFLLLFVALLVVLFKRVNRNPLGFLFMMCLTIIMFTESILERQMGIYYFLFFGLLFLLPFHTAPIKNTTISRPK
ncbi:MAG: hypothetical protein HY062_08165 [Bacteroidetes bacterium]|nr:hypothetical protein [Bacteroidota bacterium]